AAAPQLHGHFRRLRERQGRQRQIAALPAELDLAATRRAGLQDDLADTVARGVRVTVAEARTRGAPTGLAVTRAAGGHADAAHETWNPAGLVPDTEAIARGRRRIVEVGLRGG